MTDYLKIKDYEAELQKYHQDRIKRLITSLKRIVEEAEKQNDELCINRHGRKNHGTYYFYVNKERFFQYVDELAISAYDSLIDYLDGKTDPDCPQHVCPLFGLIMNSGTFHGVEMMNVDYYKALETVFSKGNNRTVKRHSADVGRYCVAHMSRYKEIMKKYPSLYNLVSESSTLFM